MLGTPTMDGTYTIPVVAKDPYGETATSWLEIRVRVNSPPKVVNRTEIKFSVLAGEAFEIDVPTDRFNDPDGDEI